MSFNKTEFGPEQAEDVRAAMEGFAKNRREVLNKEPEMLIRGDSALDAKEITRAMQIAGEAGIDTIAFSTYNQ
jgi:biopolymer transport protein ExbD